MFFVVSLLMVQPGISPLLGKLVCKGVHNKDAKKCRTVFFRAAPYVANACSNKKAILNQQSVTN